MVYIYSQLGSGPVVGNMHRRIAKAKYTIAVTAIGLLKRPV